MTWCDKSVLNPDCEVPGCPECGRHRRNFNQEVLGLYEEPHQGELPKHDTRPDVMFEVRMEMLRELSRLAHRLGQAEGMLEVCAGILKHGDTEEKKTSERIFEFLKS